MEIRRIRMAMTSPFIENMGTMIPGNMGGGGSQGSYREGRVRNVKLKIYVNK